MTIAVITATVIGAIFGFTISAAMSARSYSKGYKDGMEKERQIAIQTIDDYANSKLKEDILNKTQEAGRIYE